MESIQNGNRQRALSCSFPPVFNESTSRRAFTLVELLVVMAIIILLTALVAPSMSGIMRGSQLSQGGQMVQDELALLRQQALSKNRTVEVRLYRFADPSMAGEKTSTPSGFYRAIQGFEISEDGTSKKPTGKMLLLPNTVIMDSGILSSLIQQSPGGEITASSTTSTQHPVADPLLPRVGMNYKYVSFQIMPDGSDSLIPRSSLWYVTLHAITNGDGLQTPPPNFFTIKIDPFNGHTIIYRP